MIMHSALSDLSVNQEMHNMTKREGTVLKLECEITGNPKPIYNWYKDDELIASANRIKNDNYTRRLRLQDVPFGGKLRLEPVLNVDAGHYKCVAENSHGVRETSAFVKVNPDPLFRERYLQKQRHESYNPASKDSMPARIKSTANMKHVIPSSVINDSVDKMISSLNLVAGSHDPASFGPAPRLGDGFFYSHNYPPPLEQLSNAHQSQGRCEPYTGSVCRGTIHGRPGAHVFVSSRTPQEQIERMLEAVLTEINSQTGVISEDCQPYIAPMLCYHHLPPCADQHESPNSSLTAEMRFQRRSESATKYLPMEICQEDCVAVQTRYCRTEYHKMWSQQQYSSTRYKRQGSSMMIGDRPLVPDCTMLRRSTQPRSRNDYVGCVRFQADANLQKNSKSRIVLLTDPTAKDPALDCYFGSGLDYKGKASKTKSGNTCGTWTSTKYAQTVGENGKHNYCRNPEGDLPAPWCYTAPPYHRELCDIPKCSRTNEEIATRLFAANNLPSPSTPSAPSVNPATLSTPLTFASLPVFLPIVAVPVLFCLITVLLLCLCRNRIARRCRRSRKYRGSSYGSGSKMAPTEQERSSSSTHYYGGGFRSSASPGGGLFHQHHNNLMYGAGVGKQMAVEQKPSFSSTKPSTIQMPTYPLAALRFFEQISDSPTARVFRGEISAAFCENGQPSGVMVKMLRNTELSPSVFNAEVEMLAGLQHPNIAQLLGVCYGPRPWCLLFDCLSIDTLRQFLVNSIRQPYTGDDQELGYDEMAASSPFLRQGESQFSVGTSSLEHSDLIYIAIQIAAALEHMTGQQQLVHRELSSYTVNIGDHLLAKVLPYSASRSGSAAAAVLPPSITQSGNSGPIASRGRLSSLSSSGQDCSNSSPIMSPHCGRVAWLAPETILYGRQSAESDVWSYGIILWELFSYGCEPYSKASQMPGTDDRRVAELILGRSLLQRPTAASGLISDNSADCPQFVYELMLECWDEIPSRRPTFSDIHARLLQWRTEGLFRLRPASSAAMTHTAASNSICHHNEQQLGYESNFPIPPVPCHATASQHSSSAASTSSHHQTGDATSASTHHTITSVGSSDNSNSNVHLKNCNRLNLPPPVPPPHFDLHQQFDTSYNSDGGVYCGESNCSNDQAIYENQAEEEAEQLLNVHQLNNEALASMWGEMYEAHQHRSASHFQQQVRRSSAKASPMLPPRQPHPALGSFSTSVGGQLFAGNTGKRRLLVMSTDSDVATVAGRVGQTTAM